jgi:hypothetical protein
MPASVLISPTGMHLILIPLVLVGHSNTTMFHVSFLSSIGDADLERSDGQIEYFDSRNITNHAGTDISRAPGLREKYRTSSPTAIGNFDTGFACPSQRLRS